MIFINNIFYDYFTVKDLACNMLSEPLVYSYVASSSCLSIYPFQVASTNFIMNAYYNNLGGAVLCSESGLGKSHEALLVVSQFWLSSRYRVLIVLTNNNLLQQWVDLLESYYDLPFVVIKNYDDWNLLVNDGYDNPFNQDAIVITTQKFLYSEPFLAHDINWDLVVLDEATSLSTCYLSDDNTSTSISKVLKDIFKSSFKLLLTGTPIEKNLMDLYGLIYFIDNSVLGDHNTFLRRYLRKPELYSELTSLISPYCFRTTRDDLSSYSCFNNREHIAIEFDYSQEELAIYNLIYEYCSMEHKLAFPDMSTYDLLLKFMGILSSSTSAILKTLKGVADRLERIYEHEFYVNKRIVPTYEFTFINRIKYACLDYNSNGFIDTKAKTLLDVINLVTSKRKQDIFGAKKILIFIENLETQKYLYNLLKNKYKVVLFNGENGYSAIKDFKDNSNINILLATDHCARGFNLQECNIVIHYDLTYNTLKMEQRISRCHRMGQQYDVLSICLINRTNLSDVRKLELIKKRLLVADGVIGITDTIIGGFTEYVQDGFSKLTLRTPTQIQQEYCTTLENYKNENLIDVKRAEDLLFTKFSPELAQKYNIIPEYIDDKRLDFKLKLWCVLKLFFDDYNLKHGGECIFILDDDNLTITATNYKTLPMLFYYSNGKQSRPYYSLESYGLNDDFKPANRRLTPTSPLVRGILDNFACPNYGSIKLENSSVKACKIGFYRIRDKSSQNKEYIALVGLTKDNILLSHSECLNILKIPVVECVEDGSRSPSWLKQSTNLIEVDELDNYLDIDSIICTPEYRSSKSSFKLKKDSEVVTLENDLKLLEVELGRAKNDKIQKLALTRKLNKLKNSIRELKASPSVPASQDISNTVNKDVKVIREFLVNIN